MATEHIKAYPSKRLFIDILTQDVSVKTCILDLVDNSFDNYVRNNIKGKRQINLTIEKNFFEILDTCGGIEKQSLIDDVFRFGSMHKDRSHPTLGMYGIGLKRSIFKLGNKITLETDDGKNHSLMKMNVETWAQEDEWNIPFTLSQSKLSRGAIPFTRIKVENLNPEVNEKFGLVSFLNDIKDTLQRVYCFISKEKIDFTYNTKKVVPFDILVPYDDKYKPSVHIEKYLNKVDIHIICFVDPSKGTRLQNAINKVGWNVFCNERMILWNDTSEATGWKGEGKKTSLPKYHQLYNEFRGLVFLKANNPFDLPLNTSKSGLNAEDPVYQHLLNLMIKCARPVIDYLSSKYETEQKEEEEINQKLEIVDPTTDEIKTIDVSNLNKNSSFAAPTKVKEKKNSLVTISYKKDKKIVDKVKHHLNAGSNKEIGERTFDYYVDLEAIQ